MVRQTIEDNLAKICLVGSWSCWKLPNQPDHGGYVRVMMNRKTIQAHRAIYEELIGPIPRGLTLDHLCRNPWCCNPNHVEPVTHKVNVLRGNNPCAKNARKMVCKRGHRFTHLDRRGNRACRVCQRLHEATYRRNMKKPWMILTTERRNSPSEV